MTEIDIPAKSCPQCGKPAVLKYRPFCSARCKQVDLGKWFNEAYVIPGETASPADEEDMG
ncbi:DNA gyrase inhibitor YacG [Sneathiella sp.]|uniref:DNA gyrase inhibitor YacG n=1 Tax=Sneathiella sp. TaxID=1964365 RepID=UPI0025D59B4B|nr:DNA gyrase inhibitor YacG [Sneathiella sp.]